MGPLYKYSTYRHEDYYGKQIKHMRPGTPHEGKQSMENMFMVNYLRI